MTTIYFLEAAVPLTKRFVALKNGTVEKEAYPLVSNVTSYKEEVKDTNDLFKAIAFHGDAGHCMLKGLLTRDLVQESRRGTTRTDDNTDWICLDFDRHECADLDAELTRMGLGDISYVVQYSASHGLPENEGTVSAHVFMLLDGKMPAPDLKAWLMDLNFKYLRDGLSLSRSKTVLSWPLDITTCQNDKLLYIAPPRFVKPLKDPMNGNRVHLVPKKLGKLPIKRIGSGHINVLKVEERKILNELRKAEGLPTRTAKTSWVGSIEIQNKPDVCTVTDVREAGEFIRLNINGGDSWAYWHSKDNFELIHDFKSDTWYRTKELVPGYYQALVEERQALAATPTEDGDLILAFRDLRTAEYFNGLWNPAQQRLDLYRAKNETQLDHWMKSHGRILGEFIPIWDMMYNPREYWIVDEDGHRINLFVPSPYMRMEPKADGKFPHILNIIQHMLGYEGKQDDPLIEHFLNWLACIMQRNHKPITAWVLQGNQGTGKGYFFNKIATQLLGSHNTISVLSNNVEDEFNGWIEGKLLILVDEVDVDDFSDKGRMDARLKHYITEPTMPLRKMRQATISAPNFASFIFSSNKPQPVRIESSDRRYNVGNFQMNRLEPPDDAKVEAELEAFAQFLLAHKADITAANRVMHTEARKRIQNLNVTSIDETARAVKEGDFDALWSQMPDERLMAEAGIVNDQTRLSQAYCVLLRRLAQEAINTPDNTLSRDEMLLIFQYSVGGISDRPNKFTSLLRHHGIETKQIRRNGQKTYGITVKWKISKELREELLTNPKKSDKVRRIK